MSATIDLATATLSRGSHDPDSGKHCVMELVARFAGEPWTDRPACACPVLTRYTIPLHDWMPDDQRQRLLAYVPLLAGSRSTPDVERKRGYLAATWAVKVFAPKALEAAGCADHAATLRALPDITDRASALMCRDASYATARASYATARAARAYVYAARAARASAYAAADGDGDAADAAADAAYSAWDDALACLDAMLAVA